MNNSRGDITVLVEEVKHLNPLIQNHYQENDTFTKKLFRNSELKWILHLYFSLGWIHNFNFSANWFRTKHTWNMFPIKWIKTQKNLQHIPINSFRP